MRGIDAMFTRNTPEWETPQWLFDELDAEFHFDLDPCCTHENAKCELHFTQEEDVLSQDWDGHRVFCNPPYGKQIKKWVYKAYESKALTVMLIPARTDTKWFHEKILGRAEVRFIKGRLRFSGATINAPFPSMIVIFRNMEE